MYALRKPTVLTVALALMVALVFGVLAMLGGERAKATHVQPTTVSGNPTCAQLVNVEGVRELRIQPVVDGTFTDGTLTVTIDVRDTANGPVFDFTSNIGVLAVFVKGGPAGNLYKYDPPVTSDTGLHAPLNPSNNLWYGLSHLSFCYVPTGSVEIIKTDDAGQPLAGAEFTLYRDNAPTGGTRGPEDTATSFKCTTGAAGRCTIANVTPGQYWLVETVVPPGHSGVADQLITVTSGQTRTVGPLVDERDRGAILVTKERKHAAAGPGNHPHAGVEFTVNGVTKTTDANGKACFDNLLFGDYTVHEVTPAGYKGEADKTVTVNNKASCADSPFVGETVSFKNTPLTDVTVTIDSQVDGGTASTVKCIPDGPSGSTGANGDGTFTDTNLPPGTYTCEIVIDP